MTAPNDKYIYLHKVDGGANNNKFYEMKNLGNGTMLCTYGREGADKPQKKEYPISEWNAIYREKTGPKKGYTDVTEMRAEVIVETKTSTATNSKGEVVSNDAQVTNLINLLQSYAGQVTAATYKVEAKAVTQKQVDEAQRLVNELSKGLQNHFGKKDWNVTLFNDTLTKLYVVIPRKMKKVADHLVSATWKKEAIEELLAKEQDVLDAMAGQVLTLKAQADAAKASDGSSKLIQQQQTLLEKLGLEIRPATADEIKEAKACCQTHGKRIKRVFRVTNKKTQALYDKDMSAAKNKQTKLLWHGSRRANWMNILQTGLLIRPAAAASFAGSAFGDGIYFAHEDDKSMGYTDNGRWNGGGYGSKGSVCDYMALMEVRVGKQYTIWDNSTLSSASTRRSKEVLKQHGECDSTWARSGNSAPRGVRGWLARDEYIIYEASQCTIKYLIEFE